MECSGATVCTKCDCWYYLFTSDSNVNCVKCADPNQYIHSNPKDGSGVCKLCSVAIPGCKECMGDTNICQECAATYSLWDSLGNGVYNECLSDGLCSGVTRSVVIDDCRGKKLLDIVKMITFFFTIKIELLYNKGLNR